MVNTQQCKYPLNPNATPFHTAIKMRKQIDLYEMPNIPAFISQIEINSVRFVEDIRLTNMVMRSGVPNKVGCRIPVKSGWKIDNFRQKLTGYHDIDIIDWLTYGFTLSRDSGSPPPQPATINHQGAIRFPSQINKYLRNEVQLGATMGPFTIPPFFGNIGISPLNTREKKDTSKRRIILDLSFPPGKSVNDGIRKDTYFFEEIKLTYPTIDTLAKRVAMLGKGCLLWKRDMARFFRQLPLCPRDYSLIRMRWDNLIWFDKNMPMGLRSAAFCAQKTTNAIVFVHRKEGYWSINYLDDFGSAEPKITAWKSFLALARIFEEIGAQEAAEKACAPATRMEFLGNWLDTINMTLEISPHRLVEIQNLVEIWVNKASATRKEIESLVGKLNLPIGQLR